MNLPLISVIIPTYNYAQYIQEAINSILTQDYPREHIEIIVVDDGSTDGTETVLSAMIENGIIKYYYQENKGKASATRKAIEYSTGKYIFNLDADDYFLPGKLKETVQIFEEETSVVHVANPALFIINGKEAGQEQLPDILAGKKNNGVELLLHFYNHHFLLGGGSTFAARADVLKKLNLPDGVDMYTDEMLVLGMLNKGDSFFINKPLSTWRGHTNNYTVNNIDGNVKYKRLSNSSQAVYEQVNQNEEYPAALRDIYALHHNTRMIYFKELSGTKSFKDILVYAKFCFTGNFSFKQLKTYSVFNRLLPATFVRLLKRRKEQQRNV